MIDPDAVFLAERERLEGVAYRLLGSRADAEDVVSDAYLRWRGVEPGTVRNAAALLTTITTRLALDRLRRATRDRARYVGPWLPEPLPTDPELLPAPDAPEDVVVLAESLTLGFLAVLERLSPDERAAYLLREVYGEPYEVVADALDRSPAACRQMVHRARARVQGTPRFRLDRARAEDLAGRLASALLDDDAATLESLLHTDVVLVGDGGAHRRAARRPVVGPDRVGRLLRTLARRFDGAAFDLRWVNHSLAFFVWVDGHLDTVLALTLDDAGEHVRAIHTIRNPDKLAALD